MEMEMVEETEMEMEEEMAMVMVMEEDQMEVPASICHQLKLKQLPNRPNLVQLTCQLYKQVLE